MEETKEAFGYVVTKRGENEVLFGAPWQTPVPSEKLLKEQAVQRYGGSVDEYVVHFLTDADASNRAITTPHTLVVEDGVARISFDVYDSLPRLSVVSADVQDDKVAVSWEEKSGRLSGDGIVAIGGPNGVWPVKVMWKNGKASRALCLPYGYWDMLVQVDGYVVEKTITIPVCV